MKRYPWRPGRCVDCHRKPTKAHPYLRRGLCLACYQYRRRKGLALPPKASVIYRPKVPQGRRSDLFSSAWDRHR